VDHDKSHEGITSAATTGLLLTMTTKNAINPKRKQWNLNFDSVSVIFKERGTLKLDRKNPEERRLADWRSGQKKRKDILPDELAKLNSLGLELDVRPLDIKHADCWEANFILLSKYKNSHGNLRVPKKEKRLYEWTTRQRGLKKSNKLSQEHIQHLEEIGFVFEPPSYKRKNRFNKDQEKRWDLMYNKLRDYKRKHGHCLIPKNAIANDELGQWVACQRVEFNKGTMDDTRQHQLDDLGFHWKPTRKKTEAFAYRKPSIELTT
jgi:hypothetical protein